MPNKFFVVLITFELIIISILSIRLFLPKSDFGCCKYFPTQKEHIIFNPTKALKYFYEPKPNTNEVDKADWFPYETIYTINSDSLNERFEYSVNKPKGTYRIITLGDSFTFGQYISTPNNYSELLEEMLNKTLRCRSINRFEVINLGVPGYDIQYSVERFKVRGQKYYPNLVLWLLQDGDFDEITELTREKGYELYKRYEDRKGVEKIWQHNPRCYLSFYE